MWTEIRTVFVFVKQTKMQTQKDLGAKTHIRVYKSTVV